MMITRYCPQCGAETMFDDSREFMFCSYCGAKIISFPVKAMGNSLMPQNNTSLTPQRSMPAAAQQNLVIDYSTTNQMYSLTVLIYGQKWIFPNGARKEFTLRPGTHIIGFSIGHRLWNRRVNIPYEGAQKTLADMDCALGSPVAISDSYSCPRIPAAAKRTCLEK